MLATSVSPFVTDVWKWCDGSIARFAEVKPPKPSLNHVFVDDNILVYDRWSKDRCGFLGMLDVTDASEVWTWREPKGYSITRIDVNRVGTYIAVSLGEIMGEGVNPPGASWDHPRTRLGLIGPDRKRIDWVATLVGSFSGEHSDVAQVLPSDDGAYVAVAGYGNQVAIIDVAARNPLWVKKPVTESSLVCAAFSPDAGLVYSGGTAGIVFAFDVRSGEIVGQWFATRSGAEEYGHRITCISASGDGRWVAVGTGPEGDVYVGDARRHKLVATLPHGGSTILMVQFSPDSTALASFAAGKLKIWRTADWDPEGQSTSQPASQSSPR